MNPRTFVIALAFFAAFVWASVHAQLNEGGGTGPQGLQGSQGAVGPAGSPGTSGSVITKASVNTDATGLYAWSYPAPCTSGSTFWAIAEGTNPFANTVVGVQLEGAATASTQSFRVNKGAITAVSLLGISLVSIPATIGATPINVFCE